MNEDKNTKSESHDEPPKEKLRCDEEQYKLLISCLKNRDIEPWNNWRKENVGKEIWLVGANLQGASLSKANLQGANLIGANLQGADLIGANLRGAILGQANLHRALFMGANLQGAELRGANLQGAYLGGANLQGANLSGANLQGAHLGRANLQGANLNDTNLQGADLLQANLQGALLGDANLKGSNIFVANIKGASFEGAIVDGETIVWKCQVNRHCEGKSKGTDFNGVGINSIRIDSATKQLLEYNIRRMNWDSWYKEHTFLRWPIRWFWSMSDYGISTVRIILWFFMLAVVFALLYWLQPSLVIVRGEVDTIRNFVHALYFSVVTMTTLGFGDIAANPDSWYGQVTLMIQVILGYVLLGALVTRFAVLFTAGGPAGSFTPMDKKTRELLAKLREDKGEFRPQPE